jgi:APA family basic amino acid/polyamine antiporter
VSYLGALFPGLDGNRAANAAITLVAVWGFTAVNIRGVRTAGAVQLVTTVLKLLPLLAIGAIGVFLFFAKDPRLDWHAPAAVPFSASSVTAAAALTLWALLGFESAAVAAKRVHDPRRTIPLATVIGTLVVAAIYILSCSAVMFLLAPEVLAKSGAPFADVAALLWGSDAGHAIAAFAAISGLGALNGWILLSGEVPFRLARRGVFPAVFAQESRRQVPAFALCVSSVLVTVLVLMNLGKATIEVFTFMLLLSGEVAFRLARRGVFPNVFGHESRRQVPAFALCVSSVLVTILVLMNLGKATIEVFTFMLLLSTTATLVLYLTCSVGLLVLVRRGRLGALGAHVRWLVLGGALGALYSLWTLYGAGAQALLWGLVLFASAVPVFYLMRRAAK